MPNFIVRVREVHVSYRKVTADSPEEALHDGGGGEEILCEYSHTLPQDTWDVEDTDGNIVFDPRKNRPAQW